MWGHRFSHRPLAGVFDKFALFLAVVIAVLPLLAAGPVNAASGHAALVIDAHTGRTLHARNADVPRYPASLTKIMTLYLVFDALKKGDLTLDTPMSVSANAAAQVPSKVGVKPGQTVKVRDAIGVLVTRSANDVAVVVAEHLGGTEAAFARRMTQTARRIGMSNTTFRNASGLPDSEQVTTARDMIVMAQRVMADFPEHYSFFSTRHYSYRGQRYRNHNRLLGNYSGTDGIKTGFTRASGFNLIASARRGDRHVIGVVMGGNTGASRDAHMRQLLDQAWSRALAHRDPVPPPFRNPRAPEIAARTVTAAASAVGFIPLPPARSPVPRAAPEAVAVEEGDTGNGGYFVQVGAYVHQSAAAAQLERVRAAAADLLNDRPGVTPSIAGESRALYRARFANFSEPDARDACSRLKSLNIDCIVMRSE